MTDETRKDYIKKYNDEHKEDRKIYYWEHREEILEKQKKRREANKDKIKERNRIYYQNNKEKKDSYSKDWVKNNPEKRRYITKKYRETHKEEERLYAIEYHTTQKTNRRKRKVKALEALAKFHRTEVKCWRCLENRPWCLTIGHINQDGVEDRAKNKWNSYRFYNIIINGERDLSDLKIECINCNCCLAWYGMYPDEMTEESFLTSTRGK